MISYLFKYLREKYSCNQTNKSGFNKDYRNGYSTLWIHNIRDYSP